MEAILVSARRGASLNDGHLGHSFQADDPAWQDGESSKARLKSGWLEVDSVVGLAHLLIGLEPTEKTSKSKNQNSGNNQNSTLKIRGINDVRPASTRPPI
jgi:hypothetical protein